MATSKKTTAKKAVKTTTKKAATKPSASTGKVEKFEPNKMGFAVASLAAVMLVLLGLIATTN